MPICELQKTYRARTVSLELSAGSESTALKAYALLMEMSGASLQKPNLHTSVSKTSVCTALHPHHREHLRGSCTQGRSTAHTVLRTTQSRNKWTLPWAAGCQTNAACSLRQKLSCSSMDNMSGILLASCPFAPERSVHEAASVFCFATFSFSKCRRLKWGSRALRCHRNTKYSQWQPHPLDFLFILWGTEGEVMLYACICIMCLDLLPSFATLCLNTAKKPICAHRSQSGSYPAQGFSFWNHRIK